MRAEHAGNRLTPEQLFAERYTLTVCPGGEKLWTTHGVSADSIFQQVFTPLITNSSVVDRRVRAERSRIKQQMESSDTTFIALQDTTSQKLLGYTYALPASFEIHGSDRWQEFIDLETSLPEFRNRQEHTAEFGYTVLRPEHRSTGSWSRMMDVMEGELLTRNFDEMIRQVRQENGYADKIRGRYHGRIVTEIPDIESPYGLQTYFRIQL